ncbi:MULTISPECIES: ferredoxin [unclassified Ensifer]|uniref:ferredoxin n=1 Tax=unclassified Ensifer TaxID=2633371 RepID=UPI000812E24C|nr:MULTISPECIES: ferredoxin [unclassified Ensifer]OCO98995.1 ferredoxin [Ensifer sp. LC14]OCP11383.1 ferredoxin [Ensifer sp. LC13]OCP11973.1 ferredoxin [Ensifer sp. LC11]OCP33483.1 ferredoxin [Ensifer sp. LC499]
MTAPSAEADKTIETIRAALAPHGLFLRGTVNFETGEAVPLLADSRPAASVVLIGNIGGSLWQPFSAWRDLPDRGGSDPLDTWSKAVIQPIADECGATAYFPSDPPWQPFQRWAMQAEGLKTSPLGILIHPRHGLWHGYRGAFAFDRRLPETGERVGKHPCDACAAKPCLAACPANALAAERFDIGLCRDHLVSDAGRSGCLSAGCLSREACPVASEHRYPKEQLRFHMAALQI